MSAAKSTLSDDVRHRMLPLWGLYLFKIPAPFPHHPHFCDRINHDDVMPWMVTCGAFNSTKKESTTPKGVASASHLSPRVASYRRQPWAIKSITPMGLPYHHPLITTLQHEDEDNIAVELRHHCPFITSPQREDGAPHGIYHHTTTWSMTIPSRWGCAITPLYYHIIMRRIIIPFHGGAPPRPFIIRS